MKYVFGSALLVLAYAVHGVMSYQRDERPTIVASAPAPVPAPIVSAPAAQKAFQIIRIVDTPAPAPKAAPARPANVTKDQKLAGDIQRRLTDAGCYSGPVDGVWSDDTRAASRKFIVATKAELSDDHPDSALLALLRSRGDDTSLCTGPAVAVEAENALPGSPLPGATPVQFDAPMGLGGPGSSGSTSYRSWGREDSVFRHPLGQ